MILNTICYIQIDTPGYQRLAYKHVHVHHSTEGIRLMRLSSERKEEHSSLSMSATLVVQSLLTMRPEVVTLNDHAAVGCASVVWECAAWLVGRVFLDM